MMRCFQIVGWLWLALAVGFGADQKGGAPKAPPAARVPAPAAARPKAEGVPKAGRANPPLRLANPGSMAAKLYQMTPDQRERVLEKLPAARQEQLRRNLAYFDNLPKEQQQRLIQGAERLAAMTPQREREVRQSWQAFQKLPVERQVAVRRALNLMQTMPEEQRNQLTESDQFKNRFSPDEQRIIRDISDIVMPQL